MFLLILLMAVLVAADQLTKWLAVLNLRGGGEVSLLGRWLGLTYFENTGAAWGMLRDHRWVFMLVSTVAIVGLFLYLAVGYQKLAPLFRVVLALFIAGGVGNMIDRTLVGYVVDFIAIDIPYYSFKLGAWTAYDFPIFNVADICVTVGAALMLVYMLFIDLPAERRAAAAQKENAPTDKTEGSK